jgi:alcohol dehydrogenase (NADP+)
MASPSHNKPDLFTGWVAHSPSAINNQLEWTTFTPKHFQPTDIEIAITHCGLCGSDIHHLNNGWGRSSYPMVIGHEIVGTVSRVGPAVRDRFRLGERVGIGARCKSCLRPDCPRCSRGMEQHCSNVAVITFNSRYPDGDPSHGGFARTWRGPTDFVVKIPEGVPSATAAPMLCGGVTVYAPLKEYGVQGKRVGVVGIGGLGHFAILFAKAMGAARVVAISRSGRKREDALAMGADTFIATGEEPEWAQEHADSLDLIICTVSGEGLEMAKYLGLLDVNGTLVQVGLPEDPVPPFSASALVKNNRKLAGSLIGSKADAEEMLGLAAREGIRAWVETRSMGEANEVVRDMVEGRARYRYVVLNE